MSKEWTFKKIKPIALKTSGGKSYRYKYLFDKIDIEGLKKLSGKIERKKENIEIKVRDNDVRWIYNDEYNFFIQEDGVYIRIFDSWFDAEWRVYVLMSILDEFGLVSNFRQVDRWVE